MKKIKHYLLAIMFFLTSLTAWANSEIVLSQATDSYNASNYAEVYRDSSGKLTINQVVDPAFRHHFTPYIYYDHNKYPNVTTWLRFQINNPTPNVMTLFLDGESNRDNGWSGYKFESGALTQLKTIHAFPVILYLLEIPPHSIQTIYLGRYTEGANATFFKLEKPLTFAANNIPNFLLIGFNYGIPFSLILHSLLIFIITRDKNYIIYILFGISTLSFQLLDDGLLSYIFNIKINNWWYLNLTELSMLATASFYTLYSTLLLQSKKFTPHLNKLITIYLYSTIPMAVSILFLKQHINVVTFYTIIGIILSTILGCITLYQGYKPARYYFSGMVAIFIGIFVVFLVFYNVIPLNVLTIRANQIGLNIDMILQSIALAARFALLQQEKEQAQALVLKQKDINARNQSKALREQRKLIDSYDRFFPHHFLDLLGKQRITQINLGDQTERKMLVLFSDIRNFTSIIEKKSPAAGFKFINKYLAKVGPIIRAHHGFIDKYIGDAIMALFEKSPEEALYAALEMFAALHETHSEDGKIGQVQIGIGLHFGRVIVGTIGEKKRMDGTVIGDTVNTASRIESSNKFYQTNLIISEAVVNVLPRPDEFKIRFLDHIYLHGKQRDTMIYEVFDIDPPWRIEKKMATLADYNLAIQHYRNANFADALVFLKHCQEILPEDQVVQMYINRCNQFIDKGIQPDWKPIIKLTHKGDEE